MFNSKEPIVYGQYYTLCLPLYLLCASKTAQRTLSCYRVKERVWLMSAWAVGQLTPHKSGRLYTEVVSGVKLEQE